jgi:hypothetical protein
VFGWIVLNIPSGIGMGILFASLSLATQASAEHRADCSDEQRLRVKAMAAGLNPFFRALGQAFGIAVGQAAFSNELTKKLGSDVGRDVAALVEKIKSLPQSNPEKAHLIGAFVQSLRVIWWILIALTGLLVVLTIFTREFGLGPTDAVKSDKSSETIADDHISITGKAEDGDKATPLEV